MSLAVGARVPAAGPVLVLGVGMNVMTGSCHRSSLLWCTASATMCATCWSASE
jgi:hypothetical protein